jgi:rhodanese-related sulfurtransferase
MDLVKLQTTGNETVTTTGTIRGKVEAVRIKYNGAASLTVRLKREGDADALDDIILLTGNTDIVVYPRAATHSNAAAASLYAAGGEPVEDKYPVHDRLSLETTDAGAAEVVDMEVFVS